MRGLVLVLISLSCGCALLDKSQQERARTRLAPPDLIDPAAQSDPPFVNANDLIVLAEQIRTARQNEVKPARTFNILALSGGGNYGAYCAGVLCGWSETGTRPEFDVCTGISTGALVATLAFLGPDYDVALKRVYTTLKNEDIFQKRWLTSGLSGDSLADNAPLARQIDAILTDDAIARIATAHKEGRRLYVGTTNLETRRLVTWDLGAIACHGDAASKKLIKQLLLASSAIPGFFPPQSIDIDVDGQHFQELHVDGGATSAFIVRTPPGSEVSPGQPHTLAGSNLYVLIAGKIYADQDAVKRNTLIIASNAISSVLYAITRSQLVEVYAATMLLGMNYRVSALPQDFDAPTSSTDFDPVAMTKMYDEGRRRALTNTAWQSTPPLDDQCTILKRTGVKLSRNPGNSSRATDELPRMPFPMAPQGVPGVTPAK